ncbi:hypothetical protein ABPG75_004221 [Micractinium tetrahymenae]
MDGLCPGILRQPLPCALSPLMYAPQHLFRPSLAPLQVMGFAQEYQGGLTFATLLDAGHSVPWFKPARAQYLVGNWVGKVANSTVSPAAPATPAATPPAASPVAAPVPSPPSAKSGANASNATTAGRPARGKPAKPAPAPRAKAAAKP